jgi:hypothetical protein
MKASKALFFAILLAVPSTGTGCAYRLYRMVPSSQERIKIIASAPQDYVISVDTGKAEELQVPTDGRVDISIPSYRPTCGIYLFNEIKVGGGVDRSNNWYVSASRAGNPVRRLSLRQIRKLPVDESGYHLLQLSK